MKKVTGALKLAFCSVGCERHFYNRACEKLQAEKEKRTVKRIIKRIDLTFNL